MLRTPLWIGIRPGPQLVAADRDCGDEDGNGDQTRWFHRQF